MFLRLFASSTAGLVPDPLLGSYFEFYAIVPVTIAPLYTNRSSPWQMVIHKQPSTAEPATGSTSFQGPVIAFLYKRIAR